MRPITIPLVQETVETPKELVQESVEQHIHDAIVEARPNPVDEPLREPTKEFQPAQGEVFDIFPTPMFRGYMDLDHEQVSQDVRDMVSKVKRYTETMKKGTTLLILTMIYEHLCIS